MSVHVRSFHSFIHLMSCYFNSIHAIQFLSFNSIPCILHFMLAADLTSMTTKRNTVKKTSSPWRSKASKWAAPHWWLKANIRSKTTAHRPQKKKLHNSQLAAEADKSSCGQRWHKKGKQLHPRWSDTQHAKAQRVQTWADLLGRIHRKNVQNIKRNTSYRCLCSYNSFQFKESSVRPRAGTTLEQQLYWFGSVHHNFTIISP